MTQDNQNQENLSALREQLAAFRNAQLHKMTLPESGLTVTLKRVDLMSIITQGVDIPDSLSGLVGGMVNGGIDTAEIGFDDIGGFGEMLNIITIASVVSPPVIAGAGDDTHLGTNEIPFADKQEIFNFGNGEASALIPFREADEKPGMVSLAGEDVQPAAV